ncbi:hypothetical protein [Litorilituus sediminis]|uniref:Uncharacterized protein n=1 Tax=Litorilituus sediminis TaxID=718192 RepID=A0A4P6P3W6_9GAMM|nr:hypothetical protein [Litorilituus sediminis]QBG35984.1 hypothetical protein EMK97_09795 [Litorilituus sediminis]
MSKRYLVLMTTLFLAAIFYTAEFNTNSDDIEIVTNTVAQKQRVPSNNITEQKAVLPDNLTASTTDNSKILRFPKIPYEGDWCIKRIELTEQDYQFAQQELIEWENSRGRMLFSSTNFDGEHNQHYNSNFLEPYKEMDKNELVENALKDDRYALISAIQRKDIDSKTKKSLANKLMILGDTSTALLYLYSIKTFEASYEYRQNKLVTSDVKRLVKDALTYIFYGISRYDTDTLSSYLYDLRDDETLKTALHPKNILTPQDFDDIKKNVQSLSAYIDEQRSQNNLMPINQLDIPKIANHDFQENLAILYLEHGDNLDSLQAINSEHGPNIKRTDCVAKYAKLYGN